MVMGGEGRRRRRASEGARRRTDPMRPEQVPSTSWWSLVLRYSIIDGPK
jgi:hypothetical protein